MRLARAITVLAAGAATAWFLDRRQLLPGRRPAELPWPPGYGPQEGAPEARAPEPAAAPPPPAPAEVPDAVVDSEPEIEPDPEPGPKPQAERALDPDPDPPLADPVFAPSEQPTREQPAIEQEPEPVDVTSLVDDLIGAGGREDAIVDAEVVEDSGDDERIARTVSDVLAILPDVPSEGVSVAVSGGTVILRGEVDRAGTIREVEERVRQIDGVTGLRNLLHLPGDSPAA